MQSAKNSNQMMKPTRILVTGATGLVGMRIIDAAISRGWITTTTARSDLKQQGRHHTHVKSDITSTSWCDDVYESIGECDVIIHAAANINFKAATNELWKSNVEGTINALRLGQRWGTRQIVFMSTLGMFSECEGTIKEDRLIAPQGSYYKSKFCSEQILMTANNLGIIGNVAILRISAPIGRGMPRQRMLSNFIKQAVSDSTIRVMEANRHQDYIDTRDIARAVALTTENNANGYFNICSGKRYSNKEVAYACIEATGSRSQVEIQDDSSGNAAYTLTRSNFCNKKAEIELGFKATLSLSDTIKNISSQDCS